MKVLITGITGLAGTHLSRMLSRKEDIELYGTYRVPDNDSDAVNSFGGTVLSECDIRDVSSIKEVLDGVRPDIIFHFAAYVSVHGSFENALLTFQTNVMGTANLLEAVKQIVPDVRMLIPGSVEVYGRVPQEKMPIKEDYPLNPVSPYGISKRVQEELGLYYCKAYNLNLFFTRAFHLTGPGQPLGFVCSDLARQVVIAEKDNLKSINTGNLMAKRDFTDIRDIVNAYWQVIDKGEVGQVYNVCSGRSLAIQEILNKLIGFLQKKIPVEVDASKLRPFDIPDFIGDNTKLKGLGWEPKYSIDDSLKALLERWRNEIYKK